MNVTLFPGSFNPVHNGHIALAKSLIEQHLTEEIWLSATPQNPLKAASVLLNDNQREEMLRLAVEGLEHILVTTIEKQLPQPNYTINTLNVLAEQYPEHQFSLLIGGDNAEIITRWFKYDELLEKYQVFVYPRIDCKTVLPLQHPHLQLIEAPLFPISSTKVREAIAQGDNISEWIAPKVQEYIINNNIYK